MSYPSQSYRPLVAPDDRPHTSRQIFIGYGLAVLGAALFSLKAILIKLAYRTEPSLAPLTLLAIRMGIAMPIYGLIALWAVRKRAKTKKAALGICDYIGAAITGVFGYYIAALMDFSGLQYMTAQLERLILFTYPAFVMVLGALFFDKPVRAKSAIGIGIAYLGIAVIFARGSITSGANVWLGVALVTGAALSFALFQLLASPQIKKIGASIFTSIAMLSAGGGILLHYFIHSGLAGQGIDIFQISPSIWGYGFAIALVATLIPSFMVNIALGRIGAQKVSVLGMMGPVFLIALAVTILGESFTWVDGLGTLFTIVGIGIYSWYARGVGSGKSAVADTEMTSK